MLCVKCKKVISQKECKAWLTKIPKKKAIEMGINYKKVSANRLCSSCKELKDDVEDNLPCRCAVCNQCIKEYAAYTLYETLFAKYDAKKPAVTFNCPSCAKEFSDYKPVFAAFVGEQVPNPQKKYLQAHVCRENDDLSKKKAFADLIRTISIKKFIDEDKDIPKREKSEKYFNSCVKCFSLYQQQEELDENRCVHLCYSDSCPS